VNAHPEKCSTGSKITTKEIVSGGEEGALKVWTLSENKFTLKVTYSEHAYPITALDSNADHIVSGDAKSNVIIWKVSDGYFTKIRQGDQHQEVQGLGLDFDINDRRQNWYLLHFESFFRKKWGPCKRVVYKEFEQYTIIIYNNNVLILNL
jgi:WD40 repeat protein